MPKIKFKRIVGLTGGIASGKSAVLNAFRRLGAKTVDCDALARQAVQPGRPALGKIRKTFGPAVFAGKNLDRDAMGTLVFSDPAARRKLEAIIHPEVILKLKQEIRRLPSGLLVCDVPLLFEAKLAGLFDDIVVVWAPEKTQLQRLTRRSGLPRTEALRRLRSQIPLSRKRKRGDFVIDNSRSLRSTEAQVRALHRRLTAHP